MITRVIVLCTYDVHYALYITLTWLFFKKLRHFHIMYLNTGLWREEKQKREIVDSPHLTYNTPSKSMNGGGEFQDGQSPRLLKHVHKITNVPRLYIGMEISFFVREKPYLGPFQAGCPWNVMAFPARKRLFPAQYKAAVGYNSKSRLEEELALPVSNGVAEAGPFTHPLQYDVPSPPPGHCL